MSFIENRCKVALEQCKQVDRLRRLPSELAGVDFFSNDYLGLARDRDLQKEIAARWATHSGNGSTGARLLSGNSQLTEVLEAELAEFFDAEAALLLGTGYMAALALLSSLPRRGDLVLYDAYIHACAKDAVRLSWAEHRRFSHNNLDSLNRQLERAKGRRCFVLSEGLFSMSGDLPPIEALLSSCEVAKAALMLDEAHSTGIFGRQGQGLLHERGLSRQVPLRMHTFGKAWGAQGACLLGSRSLVDYLINFARPFIYTTAAAPVQVHTLRAVLERFKREEVPLGRLRARISYFAEVARQLPEEASVAKPGPIQAIRVRGSTACRQAAAYLQAAGYAIMPILSPTVAEGNEQLRICLHSFNTEKEIEGLVNRLRHYLKKRVSV